MKIFKIKWKAILLVLLGIIIGSSITVYASGLLASQIKYEKDENEITVEDALNDLYQKSNKEILQKFELKMRTSSYSKSYCSVTNYMIFKTKIKNNYQYFKITGHSSNSYVAEYKTYGHYKDNTYPELQENVEYSFDDYKNIWSVVNSKTEGQEAYTDVYITFYNK